MIILSIVEPVLLVVILAVALTQVRRRLTIISNGLGDLGGMLATVESGHLRPLAKLVADINGPLNTITGDASRDRRQGRPGRSQGNGGLIHG